MAGFVSGQSVWVRLPLELGIYYEFAGTVVRVLPAMPGEPRHYEVEGAIQGQRYFVEEGWLAPQGPVGVVRGGGKLR
jgi:hypothetical protein